MSLREGSRPEVVLIRHGATEWSMTGQHTGATDLPLLAVGEDQARAVGELLAGTEWGLVLTSPRLRARDTCRLAGLCDGPWTVAVDDDLVEWDYGAYEGLTTAEIQKERPGWDLWRDGVPGGETAGDVGRRADRVISRVRAVPGPVACVAHGHLLRVLAARWLGLPPVAGALTGLAPASVSRLGWERENPVIEQWNLRAPGSR